MVYSTLLIDLRNPGSKFLNYYPPPEGFNGPVDDIIQFAYSAKREVSGEGVNNYVGVV